MTAQLYAWEGCLGRVDRIDMGVWGKPAMPFGFFTGFGDIGEDV
jgi:hypothetical protein